MKKLILSFALFLAPVLASADVDVMTVNGSLVAQEPAADFEISHNEYYRYSFGHVWMHNRVPAEFIITARGPANSIIRGMRISGSMFDAYSNCPRVLVPGQRCSVTVYFWPRFEGSHYGRLDLAFADKTIVIDLYGYGVR